MSPLPADIESAYRITAVIVGLGQIIGSAESIALQRNGSIEKYLPWRIVRMRARDGFRPHMLGVDIAPLFQRRPQMMVGLARMAAAVGLIFATPHTGWFAAALAVLFLGLCIDSYRGMMGGEGSDQMFLLVITALLIGGNAAATVTISSIALAFIAGQCVLSYVTSGLAKLFSSAWRSGSGLAGVLSTHGHGVPAVGRLLWNHRWMALAGSWTVIIFESTFVLSLINPQVAAAYIAVGLAFHVSVAYLMGLNLFLFAFAATYPALMWASGWVHGVLHG